MLRSAESETNWSFLNVRSPPKILRTSASVTGVSFKYNVGSPAKFRFNVNSNGNKSDGGSEEVVSGKSTFTCALPTITGTVIIKTIKSTSVTSTSGVTLIALKASSSSPYSIELLAAMKRDFRERLDTPVAKHTCLVCHQPRRI